MPLPTATDGCQNRNSASVRSNSPASSCRRSFSNSTASSGSRLRLPSPSIAIARVYFLEQFGAVEPFNRALQDGATAWQQKILGLFPMPDPRLTNHLESFAFGYEAKGASPKQESEVYNSGLDPTLKSTEAIHGESTPGNLQQPSPAFRKSVILPLSAPEMLRQVPFEYTHCHLKNWGYAYLGDIATADTFVNAVSFCRSRAKSIKEEGSACHPVSPGLIKFRARVLPKSKTRKPFLIQKEFDISELRASMPAPPASDKESPGSARPHCSARCRWAPAPRNSPSQGQIERMPLPLRTGAVPIHIEYALHYLPALAALMLSGHIGKGDTIDLPIPHPEAWWPVVAYVYTGNGEVTTAMQENIFWLAGITA